MPSAVLFVGLGKRDGPAVYLEGSPLGTPARQLTNKIKHKKTCRNTVFSTGDFLFKQRRKIIY